MRAPKALCITSSASTRPSRQALASLRVMASCMGTGQAAGVAAAQSVASRRPVQEIDTARLVSTLKDLGTVL